MEDIAITWNGHTSQVAINKAGQDLQTFTSNIAKDKYGGNKRFTGQQFHFHAGSEHTVDGLRHDLEMHTVHLANEVIGAVKYAAMGIFFSENEFTRQGLTLEMINSVDKFFETM